VSVCPLGSSVPAGPRSRQTSAKGGKLVEPIALLYLGRVAPGRRMFLANRTASRHANSNFDPSAGSQTGPHRWAS
jgi:hypothetical protein